MDCVILAGNRENYRKVSHKDNKAFLVVDGRSILSIMMDVLAEVDVIDRLLIVGPKRALDRELKLSFPDGYVKEVVVYEQQNDLVANIRSVFERSGEHLSKEAMDDRTVLVIPSDIPLLTTAELRQFLTHCHMDRYDYVGGLTTDAVLSRFEPTDDRPGIEMACFYCEMVGYRISNLHMVRPRAFQQGAYISRTYALRYQKKAVNALAMLLELIKLIGRLPSVAPLYVSMRLARRLHVMGLYRIARVLQKFATRERVDRLISKILGLRFKTAVTTFGGSAIDIDNDEDYVTICERFDEWLEMLASLGDNPAPPPSRWT